MKLNISEIFYSLQGEGARIGVPTVFIRLQGCKTKNACAASGIVCDTEFESGKEWSIKEVLQWLRDNANGCNEITWTGGEPLDQLTDEIVAYFKNLGYYQAIETSGLKPPKTASMGAFSPTSPDAKYRPFHSFPIRKTHIALWRSHWRETPVWPLNFHLRMKTWNDCRVFWNET